jgi:hypothetical protein
MRSPAVQLAGFWSGIGLSEPLPRQCRNCALDFLLFRDISADRHGGDGDLGLRGQSDRDQGVRLRGAGRARHWLLLAGAGLLLMLGLAGCGTITDETAGRATVSPGKYDIYPCPNIEAQIQSVQRRRTELEQLMARSSQSAGGEFVNALAYRTEYLQTGGDLEELARASSDKKCAVDSKYSSARRVY